MKIGKLAIEIVASVLVAGCTGGGVEDLQRQVGRLQTRLHDAQSKLQHLQELRSTLVEAKLELGTLKVAVDKLKSATLMIGYVDARVAVLGVQAVAEEIEGATLDIESSIDDAIRAVR